MTNEAGLWSERQRLAFIERVLFWRGYINRRELMAKYGISPPQATNDLVNYSTRNAGGTYYNVRKKRYEVLEGMKPVLIEPDFGLDMEIMEDAGRPFPEIPFVTTPECPRRSYDRAILQTLSRAAHRGQSVEVHYFSAHSGSIGWRRISPRAFVDDGLRWHVRAYCHNRGQFSDFNLSRMKGARNPEDCAHTELVDTDWLEFGVMTIGVNPELDKNQSKALNLDYGMTRGRLKLTVRKAHRLYTARRMGFIKDPGVDGFPILNELRELVWLSWEDNP